MDPVRVNLRGLKLNYTHQRGGWGGGGAEEREKTEIDKEREGKERNKREKGKAGWTSPE